MAYTTVTEVEIQAKPSVRVCQEGQHCELENANCEASYNCIVTWKISKVHQKKLAAEGVLYSPPFYTGQKAGYKLRLFLYNMDGDGSGRGTHLSFFHTLMRGEYDALLTWPFKQKFAMILQDQDQQKHIAKCFKPDLSDAESMASFQRPSPHSEMNIPFGCPKFAPLSVLDKPSYIKDETMILKCIINTTGAG